MALLQPSCHCITKNLLPITVFIISEAEAGEATALGLPTALQQYEFVAGVYFIAEVLPHLVHLSMCFQEGLIWHEVQPLLDAILKVLKDIAESSTKGKAHGSNF